MEQGCNWVDHFEPVMQNTLNEELGTEVCQDSVQRQRACIRWCCQCPPFAERGWYTVLRPRNPGVRLAMKSRKVALHTGWNRGKASTAFASLGHVT